MAHTPGPWFAFNADYQGRSDEAPIFVIGPQEFHTVAKVRAGCHDDDLPAQTPTNAALIAAAPDLLAALEAMVAPFATITDGTLSQYENVPQPRAILQARAAIAKAKAKAMERT